jgi:hypothetical protein
MNEQAVHKTLKYKLRPTSAHAQAMGTVLRRCRKVYNAGL